MNQITKDEALSGGISELDDEILRHNARRICRFNSGVIDRDDLYIEGWIALEDARRTFQPTRSWETWANLASFRGMMAAVRRWYHDDGRGGVQKTVARIEYEKLLKWASPTADLFQEDSFQFFLNHLFTGLDTIQREIAHAYWIEGLTLREIGERFKRTESAMCLRVQTITQVVRTNVVAMGGLRMCG